MNINLTRRKKLFFFYQLFKDKWRMYGNKEILAYEMEIIS